MFDSRHLHIAIASDENYAQFVATLIASICDNNEDFEKISFHLLTNGITKESISKIQSIIPDKNRELIIYDISNLQERLGIKVPNTIALTSYSRLFLDRIIGNDISKILYLDTDIIIASDLSKLWNIDIDNYYIGGCLDIFEGSESKTAIGLSANAPYINAGVLLINLDMWRENSLSNKFMDFLYRHGGNVRHHDQGIINGVCKDKIHILPLEYNLHSTVYSHKFDLIQKISSPHYSKEEYENAKINPVIIHFTEGFYNRPWKENCKHPMRQYYLKYKALTPWRQTAIQPDNRSIAVKLLSFMFLNLPYNLYKLGSNFIGFISKLFR